MESKGLLPIIVIIKNDIMCIFSEAFINILIFTKVINCYLIFNFFVNLFIIIIKYLLVSQK